MGDLWVNRAQLMGQPYKPMRVFENLWETWGTSIYAHR